MLTKKPSLKDKHKKQAADEAADKEEVKTDTEDTETKVCDENKEQEQKHE